VDGEEGSVYGIDIASPDYGSPVTLGDAAEHLQKSHLGDRIRIQFEMDILSPEVGFPIIILMSSCCLIARGTLNPLMS